MSDHDTLDAAVLQALQDSTKASTDSGARLEIVEGQVQALESTIDDRMSRLETQMGTTNAHLDNFVREASITNNLLQQDITARVAERKRLQSLDDDERKRVRLLADEERRDSRDSKKANRAMLVTTGKELWSIFKQPLGYLVAAGLAYAAFSWFGQEGEEFSMHTFQVEQSAPASKGTPPN